MAAAGVGAAGAAVVMTNLMTQLPGRMTAAAMPSTLTALALRELALPPAVPVEAPLDRVPAWACHRLLQVPNWVPEQLLEWPPQHETLA